MQERYVVTADLGSSKIALTVARITDDVAEIIYSRETPSDGIRYSCVFNPTRAAAALKRAVSEAETELDIKIHQLVVGLPRYSVRQEMASATIERSDPDSCITAEEIRGLKSIAYDGYPIDDNVNETIYGGVVQSFTADDLIQASEEDVIGTVSSKIDGNYKLFIGSRKAVDNIDVMLNNTGLACARKIFLPHHTARAVLTADEMENGCGLVEIGAGVSSISLYRGGILRYYASIPYGGKVITSDIKYEGSFNEKLAENIKLAYGACIPEKLQSMSEKILQINDDETGSYVHLPVKYLSEVITARMREIFDALLFLIQDSGMKEQLRSGLVITGGGAGLTGAANLLREMSGYNVKTGYPRLKGILSNCPETGETAMAASAGMILSCCRDSHINCVEETGSKAAAATATTAATVREAPAPAVPVREESREAVHEPVQEKPAETDLFGNELEQEAPRPKKKAETRETREPAAKPTWKLLSKISSKVTDTLDNTLGTLFDQMGTPEE
ncbi:MAG: cell division protein FtsA [Bacteroidales bacterium]|nr:cell division protein FtsA [Bacteroidales bacterium]